MSQAPIRSRSAVEQRGAQVIHAAGDPEGARLGFLDVTRAPYHADPGGERDATAAIQRAIEDARDARLITHLPAGRYRISDTLVGIQGTVKPDQWLSGPADPMVTYDSHLFPCTLAGPRDGGRGVLFLAPETPGFNDPARPKPLVHFWARAETPDPKTGRANPAQAQPNISFAQQIRDLEIDLGGNPGAIAIDHQAAQWSVVADVTIQAAGAFGGLRGLPGSGGGVHGLTVHGGRYGILARGFVTPRGSQPVPVVTNLKLQDQIDAAILFDGRGPLTIVGASIEGAGIVGDGDPMVRHDGPITLVDGTIRVRNGVPAVQSRHPVVLLETYFCGTSTLVEIEGRVLLRAHDGAAWTHVIAWASPDRGVLRVNGKPTAVSRIDDSAKATPPADLTSRHAWARPVVGRRSSANVRSPPYSAAGDGRTDDVDALQRAIDEATEVFLPKGEFAISRPLRLQAHTRLIGVGPFYSTILPLAGAAAFSDARAPAPLIETVDDPDAATTLALLELRVPVMEAGAFALRWRAGRGSTVREVAFERTFWDPDAPPMHHPLVRIEGHGGGRWYQFAQMHWWAQSPRYRHLLVDGAREPLCFYMLNPEHAVATAQCEFRRAAQVTFYGVKAEGNFSPLWFVDCDDVRVVGYGGLAAALPGDALIRFERCKTVLVVNAGAQLLPYRPHRWNAFGISVGPEGWNLLQDDLDAIPSTEQIVYYRRDRTGQ